MGRAERRRQERQEKLEARRGNLLPRMSKEELAVMRERTSYETSKNNVEMLMTCFALAEHRLYKFGHKRIVRSLRYIEQLMEYINNDKATIEDYKKELEAETGIIIACEG